MIGGMTTLADISSTHWQLQIGADGVVEGIDDIHQCIRVILGTDPGEDPLRPEFGAGLRRHLDKPLEQATPLIVRDTVSALKRWEPRIDVVRVLCERAAEAAVLLRVIWRLAGTASSLETEVAL